MSAGTEIEWTDATWNPTRGCTRVSEGCRFCYAERMAARFAGPGMWGHGFAEMRDGEAHWTGHVALMDRPLDLPLHWKMPRRIFVNSTSDLFHEKLSFTDIAQVFFIMIGEAGAEPAPAHTYQILTKRPGKMLDFFDWLKSIDGDDEPWLYSVALAYRHGIPRRVWLGVSVEDQRSADERIPLLLRAPAMIRFLSCEPLLGPVDLTKALWVGEEGGFDFSYTTRQMLHWCIGGGESGPRRRAVDLQWLRSLRDQCRSAKVAFFCKQIDKKIPIPDDLRIREFPKQDAV